MKKKFILLMSAVIMSMSICIGCTSGNSAETAESDQKVAEVVETAEDDQKATEVVETALEAANESDVETPYDEWTDEEVIARAIDDLYADYPEIFEATFTNSDEPKAICNYTTVDEIKEAALEAYRESGFPVNVRMYSFEEDTTLAKEVYVEPWDDDSPNSLTEYYSEWVEKYGIGRMLSLNMYGTVRPYIGFTLSWGYTGEVDDKGYHLWLMTESCTYFPSFYPYDTNN